MRHTLKYWIKHYLFYLGGDQPLVTWIERLRAVSGAFFGLLTVFLIAKYLGELTGFNEWLMASLGASALLVFALPGSPMAQPWGKYDISASWHQLLSHHFRSLVCIAGCSSALHLRYVYFALPASAGCSCGFNSVVGTYRDLPICIVSSDG